MLNRLAALIITKATIILSFPVLTRVRIIWLLLAVVSGGRVMAVEPSYAFNIPAQAVDIALTNFAQQANLTLIFPYELVQGLHTQPVSGEYVPLDAAQKLLQGTGLCVVVSDSGYWRLEQTQRAERPPVTLQDLGVASAGIDDVLSIEAAVSQNIIEEVMVTGIRDSLRRSREVKRRADGILDTISAEDIGRFPDGNLAESLQRITGVSIDRNNNEGNQVSVRGFGPTYNLVTLNGRQMPSSSTLIENGINRSFNFREVSSESVAGVDVLKTGAANMPSGGLGSTINIITSKPLDLAPNTGVLSLKALRDTSVSSGDQVTPELSLMYSVQPVEDQLGLLVSLSHSRRDSGRDVVGSEGWPRNRGVDVDVSAIDTTLNPSQTFWTPLTLDVDLYQHQRERNNAQLRLQWAPNSDWDLSFDYVGSRFVEQVDMNRSSFWFDTDVTGVADANGVVTNPSRQHDELNFWAWHYFFETHNDSYGFNVQWQPSDSFSSSLDYHDSGSHSQPQGDTSEIIINLKNPRVLDTDGDGIVDSGGVDIALDVNAGARPTVIYDATQLRGGDPFSRDNIVFDLYQTRGYEVDNRIRQLQAHTMWQGDSSTGLTSFDVGAAHTDYSIHIVRRRDFGFVEPDFSHLDIDIQPSTHFGEQIGGSDGLFPYHVIYDARDALALLREQQLYVQDPSRENDVQEKTWSVFTQAKAQWLWADVDVQLVTGLRWEQTRVVSDAFRLGLLGFNYVNTAGAFEEVWSDEKVKTRGRTRYQQWLPNVDLRLSLHELWLGRLSYSVTNSRPDLSAMTPDGTFSVKRGGPAFSLEGNPELRPLMSENIDLSIERYYGDSSYLSIGAFTKYVQNFIGTEDSNSAKMNVLGQPLTDPSVNPRPGCPDEVPGGNPACFSQPDDPVIQFYVVKAQNLGDATVTGWEFNWQHMYGDSGFGSILNATLVESNVAYDPYQLENTYALTGLSDSANAVLFYENDDFRSRLAYNWRDHFLLSLGQSQASGEPTFTEAYGQWDLTVSYDWNASTTLVFEGINLTQETLRRHGRFSNQLVSLEQYGARYALGLTLRF